MRTFDLGFIRDTMTHPRVWPHIADDKAGAPEDFAPVLSDALVYLAPEHDGRPVGVFLYHPHNGVCWEVHTCVLPEFWGPPALGAARAGLGWMVAHAGALKVVTQVPAPNLRALRFAEKVGMVREGVNRRSFQKAGMLHDQITLGITKEEILSCQPQP